MDVDHVDGDKRNNTAENLRTATRQENSKNVNCPLGVIGIRGAYRVRDGKYKSQICVNGVRVHLGYFDTPEDAGKAYIAAADKFHGEFAFKNRPSLNGGEA